MKRLRVGLQAIEVLILPAATGRLVQAPNDAVARPAGLAMGPDGSLSVAEDAKGRIWRIVYTGR
jgi:glucose/arabinose dehydrogenase